MRVPVLMIVDDDLGDRFLLNRTLRNLPFDIETVEIQDGVEGLAYFRRISELGEFSRVPNLVLLDINMPRMNGLEFLDAYAELIAASPRLRTNFLVMLTSVSREDEQRCRQYDFVCGKISKDPGEMSKTLDQVSALLQPGEPDS